MYIFTWRKSSEKYNLVILFTNSVLEQNHAENSINTCSILYNILCIWWLKYIWLYTHRKSCLRLYNNMTRLHNSMLIFINLMNTIHTIFLIITLHVRKLIYFIHNFLHLEHWCVWIDEWFLFSFKNSFTWNKLNVIIILHRRLSSGHWFSNVDNYYCFLVQDIVPLESKPSNSTSFSTDCDIESHTAVPTINCFNITTGGIYNRQNILFRYSI